MLELLGAGIMAGGNLLGGKKRDKRAMRQLGEVQDAADLVVDTTVADQNRAIEYKNWDQAAYDRAYDEYVKSGAKGLDLKKLRSDAVAAGFNPLTVLGATGGAGYGNPEPGMRTVLTTPFIGFANAMQGRVDARTGMASTVVQTAGYFGDALAGLGNSIMGIGADQAQRQHELALIAAERAGRSSSPGAISGTTVSGGRSGGATPFVGASVASVSPKKAPFSYASALPDFDDMENVKGDETTYPIWSKARASDGSEYIIANPDLDNEWLEGIATVTVPAQWFGNTIAPYLQDSQGVGWGRRAARALWPPTTVPLTYSGNGKSAGGFMGAGKQSGGYMRAR